jgi:hypothetical protein
VTGLPVVIAAVLSMAGAGPMLLGTWRGRDNPQVMSWCIWAALPLTGGVAMAGSDYMLPAVNVLAVGVSCALVAVLALRIPADRRDPPPRLRLWPGGPAPRLDLLCLPGAAAGLVLTVVVRAPVPAVVVTAATDALAFPPTYGHIWAKPHREPWLSYALYSAGGAVSLTVADWHTPAGWVYPVYLCAGDGVAAALIVARRHVTAGVLIRPVAGPLPPEPEWMYPEGPPLWPGEADGDPLIRPVAGPPDPDDGLRWYERPDWYESIRVSGLLPDLAEIASRAWMLDTVRWAQEQAASMCLGHHRYGCHECAPAALRCLRPAPGGP